MVEQMAKRSIVTKSLRPKTRSKRVRLLKKELAQVITNRLTGVRDRAAATLLKTEHTNLWRVRTQTGGSDAVSLELLITLVERLGYDWRFQLRTR